MGLGEKDNKQSAEKESSGVDLQSFFHGGSFLLFGETLREVTFEASKSTIVTAAKSMTFCVDLRRDL
jgi:hypothetical protein